MTGRATPAGFRADTQRAGAAAAAVLALKVLSSIPRLSTQAPLVAITWLTVASFVVVGVVLVTTEIPKINGWACLLVGAAAVPGDWDEPAFAGVVLTPLGYVLEYGYLAAAVALVLRYPAPRLGGRDRWLVGLLLVSAVGVRIVVVFVAGPLADGFHAPDGWPRLTGAGWWHDWVLLRGAHLVTIGALAAVAIVLAVRAQTLSGLAREAALPLVVVTAVCAVCAATDQAFWVTGTTWQYSWVPAMARDVCAAAIPIAVLVGLLRRRTAGAMIASHVLQAATAGTVAQLQAALRAALASPTLTVTTVLPDGSWVDPDGHLRAVPDVRQRAAHERIETLRDHLGRQLCVIDFGRVSPADEELVSTASAAAALGMGNVHLHADLVARRAELLTARAEAARAGQTERHRIERDLHDGAQQRFLAVAAALARADLLPPTEALAAVRDARVQLGTALTELRDYARGHGAAIVDRDGVVTAVTRLCESAPVPVTCRVHLDRAAEELGRDVQAALYFFVAEGLTNAVRHAGGHPVAVDVRARDATLHATVVDHGVGGARLVAGGGLSGLADRLASLGGHLTVADNAPPPGSTLTLTLPLDVVPPGPEGAGAATTKSLHREAGLPGRVSAIVRRCG